MPKQIVALNSCESELQFGIEQMGIPPKTKMGTPTWIRMESQLSLALIKARARSFDMPRVLNCHMEVENDLEYDL